MKKNQWLAKLHKLAFEDTRLDKIPFVCFEPLAEGIANIQAAEQSAQWTKGGLALRACVSAHCGWVGKESACLTWKHAGDERMCPHCQDNTESVSLSALRG